MNESLELLETQPLDLAELFGAAELSGAAHLFDSAEGADA